MRREGDLCGKCAQEHVGTTGAPTQAKWITEVLQDLEVLFASRPAPGWPDKASLWDLFTLEKYNGGPNKPSDLGFVLERMEPTTLAKLRDWLDDNKEEAVERNGFNSWQGLRTFVGNSAWLRQLPPGMSLAPEIEDGLPIQLVAIRTDGKKWDLNIPIRAELLRQLPHYFSERDYAKLLGMSRRAYRRLRDAIEQEGFTLNRFTSDVLDRILRGKRRGP